MSQIKRILMTFALSLGLIAPLALPATVFATDENNDLRSGLCGGVELEIGADCNVSDSKLELNGLITNVIDIFSLVVGIIAVIMIIVGGLKYITSGGDSGNVTGAKNTILYAVVGLVIVALAQVIVRFVLKETSGLTDG